MDVVFISIGCIVQRGFGRIVGLVMPRNVPPFEYMVWAKGHNLGDARYHLGQSGLSPPTPEELSLDGVGGDLAQRGHDMPPELRHRVADWWGVPDRCLMLTLGTSHAFYLLCASRLQPGDRCLVESPTYEMLRQLPRLFGARVERFERRLEDGWRLPQTLAARIVAERPAMVLLSNPHNPTGTFMQLAELENVAAACQQVGAELAVDEVYLSYLDDAPTHSARHLGEHVSVASSFTKAFGLGTIRCGWLVAAAERIEQATRYNDYISVLYPNPSAWVGLRVLDGMDALRRRAHAIRQRGLAIVEEWIASRADVGWHRPEAGVICFPRLPMADTRGFCDALLKDRGTLVVPGAFFEAPAFIRLAFGSEEATLRAGLKELSAALDQHVA
jgi:aspartate/methionine/tyrosine aminotransferase